MFGVKKMRAREECRTNRWENRRNLQQKVEYEMKSNKVAASCLKRNLIQKKKTSRAAKANTCTTSVGPQSTSQITPYWHSSPGGNADILEVFRHRVIDSTLLKNYYDTTQPLRVLDRYRKM